MRHTVTVVFSAQQRVDIPVDTTALPAAEAARAWLDSEFVRLDCTPLRPSGKLLTVDKLLVLAEAAGASAFDEPGWRQAFGHAASATVARPTVTIDLTTMKVS